MLKRPYKRHDGKAGRDTMQTVRSQLFEGITNEECARMFQCFGAREAGYEAGALISEFDGEQNAVGVLLSGSADLVRLDSDGNRTILETLEEGGVFGEVLAFSGAGGDSIFLECRRDCRVLYLDYDQITKRCENACAHHSRMVENMFRLVADKATALSERVEVLSRRSIRDKLLCYFSLLAARSGGSDFSLPFSLSALADYISADRSAMMRELKKLKEEGVVQTENRRVTILP